MLQFTGDIGEERVIRRPYKYLKKDLKGALRINYFHRASWRLLAAVWLSLAVSFPAVATDTGYVEYKTIPLYETLKTSLKWHVTAYEWKEEGDRSFDQPAAKICFWYDTATKNDACFPAEDQGVAYQSVEEISITELEKGKEAECGVLFVARNLSPGVGKLRLFSIWVYDKKGERFAKILPAVRLSDLSEYKMFPGMKGRSYAIFVVADRMWKTGEEPLYGGKHHFKVEIYRRSSGGLFELAGEYITKRRYQTVDVQDDYGVIKDEQKNIERLMRKKREGR